MRKHIIYSIVIFLMCLFLTSCVDIDNLSIGCKQDYYGNVKPQAYGPAKWVSDEPNMWFEVTTPPDDNSPFDVPLHGEMVLDDKIVKIAVFFNPANSIDIAIEKGKDQYEGSLLGLCKFGSEKLRVKVYKDRDELFNGKYRKITFVRNELTDS